MMRASKPVEVQLLAMAIQSISIIVISIPFLNWLICLGKKTSVYQGPDNLEKSDDWVTMILLPMRNEGVRAEGKIREVAKEIVPFPSVSLMILDTGSVDGTSDICRQELVKTDLGNSRWSVMELSEPGKSKGINRALEEISSEIIIMMDADTEALPGWLEEFWKTFNDDDVAVVSGLESYYDSSGARVSYKNSSDMIRVVESAAHSTPVLEGGLMGWKTTAIDGFRLKENLNADDTQISLEGIRRGFRSIVNPRILFLDKKTSKSGAKRSIRRSQGLSRALASGLGIALKIESRHGRRAILIAAITYLVLPWAIAAFICSGLVIFTLNGVELEGFWSGVNYVFAALLFLLPQGRALAWGSGISIVAHAQYASGRSHAIWDPGVDN